MASLVEARVQSSDDAEPQLGDNDQSDSDRGSSDERSDNGGENDRGGHGVGNEEEAQDEDGGEDDSKSNTGWAEAMAKILGKKTPENKSSILVKNKELEKIKEKERQEQLERQKQVNKKRAWEMMCREKPDIVNDRETEKALQRIATRGVVQLFNAVRKHQKTIDAKVKEVGGSERKKAKFLSGVSKKDFIDVLRRTEGGRGVCGNTEKDATAAAEEKPAWSVLRDDFMMGATMKDWDKDSDREEADTHLAEGGGHSE